MWKGSWAAGSAAAPCCRRNEKKSFENQSSKDFFIASLYRSPLIRFSSTSGLATDQPKKPNTSPSR